MSEDGTIGGGASPVREGGSGLLRRLRLWTLSVVFVLSVLVSAVLANVIASRLPTRIDVTGLGLHELSPRTRTLLETLPGEFEIVLAGPWSAPERAELDPGVVRQVIDTIEEIGRQSPRLRVSVLDTARGDGGERFADVFDRLLERDRERIDAQREALRGADAGLARVIERLGSMGAELDRLGSQRELAGEDARMAFAQLAIWANQARALAEDLKTLRVSAQNAIDTPILSSGVGRLDEAERVLIAALSRVGRELAALGPAMRAIVATGQMPGEVGDALGALSGGVDRWREDAAGALDAMERGERSDAIRVARALEQASVALVVGPAEFGLTALSLDAMFPTIDEAQRGEGLEADLRGHTESAVALALSALTRPNAPILIFMHANATANLFETGALDRLRRELAGRRIDSVEWGVVASVSPPSLGEIDPAGARPRVHVVISTDASVSQGDDPALSGPSRAKALADAVRGVLDDGGHVLLGLNPSPMTAWGGEDELARVLEGFGLRAMTDRTLLIESRSPEGRIVEATTIARAADSEHTIARSLGTLPTTLRWAIPIERADEGGAVEPLLRVESGDVWAEREWLGIWQSRGAGLAWRGERVPKPEDGMDDTSGAWDVAWGATRPSPTGSGTQRLVVVGSNGWFFDSERAGTIRVQGVTTQANPGNAQLFESALLWLSGQDELIAQGPSARAVARIGDISPGLRSAIAWGLIVGMPLGVLLLGLVWRLIVG